MRLSDINSASNSDCEQVWSLVDSWMHTCQTEHKECYTVPPETWKPTRLLDVHSSDDRTVVREGDEIPYRPKYATLSHCWGAGGHLTLNKKTVTKLKTGLPVDELDPTFRDAVRIARRLGSEYLWIDSLCIRQDSHDDWQQESSRMGDIYQFALFNIAASGAHNANEGCFAPRKVNGKTLIELRTDNDEYISENPKRFWDDFAETPLSLRAWVLQERFLAPRTIHWGLSELVWECNHHLVSERFPRGFISYQFSWPRIRYKTVSSLTAVHAAKTLTREHLNEAEAAWGDIISKYSAAYLTFDTDKLVALTGIVKVFSRILKDRLFAGLWEKDMELQLLWLTTDGQYTSEKIGQHIAPTWSWLSLRETRATHLRPQKNDHLLLCQILEKGGYGEKKGCEFAISDALLKIRCSLIPAACEYDREGCGGYYGRLFWQPTSERPMVGKGFLQFDTKLPDGVFDIWYMPVSQNWKLLQGVLLKSTEGESPGVYHRIGFFAAYEREEIEMIWESCNVFYASQTTTVQFDKIPRYHTPQRKPDTTAEEEKKEDFRSSYQDCDGVPQHIITIK